MVIAQYALQLENIVLHAHNLTSLYRCCFDLLPNFFFGFCST